MSRAVPGKAQGQRNADIVLKGVSVTWDPKKNNAQGEYMSMKGRGSRSMREGVDSISVAKANVSLTCGYDA